MKAHLATHITMHWGPNFVLDLSMFMGCSCSIWLREGR